jgi:hypothetical protein
VRHRDGPDEAKKRNFLILPSCFNRNKAEKKKTETERKIKGAPVIYLRFKIGISEIKLLGRRTRREKQRERER